MCPSRCRIEIYAIVRYVTHEFLAGCVSDIHDNVMTQGKQQTQIARVRKLGIAKITIYPMVILQLLT